MKIQGIYTALVTPVKDGNINRDAVVKLVDHVVSNGCSGLVALGGTGEYCALTGEQRINMLKSTIEANKNRVPVIAGVIGPGLPEAIEMGKKCKEIGADAVMVVTPYYVVPSQEGIIDFYLRFMQEVDIPLVLYNIPYRTNVNLLPETVISLLDKDKKNQVVGIKECTPNLTQASRLQFLVENRISFICGEEGLFFSEIGNGAHAAILATSNLVPQVWNALYSRIKSNDVAGASRINLRLSPLLKRVFSETNPGPLKEAMKVIGLDCGDALPPLSPPSTENSQALKEEVLSLIDWFKKEEKDGK